MREPTERDKHCRPVIAHASCSHFAIPHPKRANRRVDPAPATRGFGSITAQPCAPHDKQIIYNQMVVSKLLEDEADRIFQALADSTRRDIMARVVVKEQSVSTLALSYAMSFAAVQKHVAVLERASLVAKQRRGREQIVQANLDTVRRASLLLQQYEGLWRSRAASIADILAEDPREESRNDPGAIPNQARTHPHARPHQGDSS